MATDLANLQTARSAICLALATKAANPNYSIDGQSVTYDSLVNRLKALDEAISVAQGPFEVETIGET